MRRLDAFLGLAWATGTTPLTKCGCVLLDMLLTVLSRRGMTPSNRADGTGVVLTLQSLPMLVYCQHQCTGQMFWVTTRFTGSIWPFGARRPPTSIWRQPAHIWSPRVFLLTSGEKLFLATGCRQVLSQQLLPRRSGILSMLQLRSVCAARLLTTVVGAPKGGDPKELLLGQFVPLTILVVRPTWAHFLQGQLANFWAAFANTGGRSCWKRRIQPCYATSGVPGLSVTGFLLGFKLNSIYNSSWTWCVLLWKRPTCNSGGPAWTSKEGLLLNGWRQSLRWSPIPFYERMAAKPLVLQILFRSCLLFGDVCGIAQFPTTFIKVFSLKWVRPLNMGQPHVIFFHLLQLFWPKPVSLLMGLLALMVGLVAKLNIGALKCGKFICNFCIGGQPVTSGHGRGNIWGKCTFAKTTSFTKVMLCQRMLSDPFQFSQFWCGSLGAPLSLSPKFAVGYSPKCLNVVMELCRHVMWLQHGVCLPKQWNKSRSLPLWILRSV